MINRNKIAVIDFETGDRDPYTCPVIQIAALVIDPATLEVYEDGEFNSMSRPPDMENIKQEALLVNKKAIADVENATEEKIVVEKLANFLAKFRTEKSDWGLPILAGHNVATFDRIILDRLSAKYKVQFVHKNLMLDTYQLSFYWFERRNDVNKYNLDYLRTKFGVNATRCGSHDALVDCYDTLDILRKYMKLSRSISPKIQFKEQPVVANV